MHEMYSHYIREEEWNVADCHNHKPWDKYVDGELMDDLHAVSVSDWTNPFWGVVTADGVYCSQACADEHTSKLQIESLVQWELERESPRDLENFYWTHMVYYYVRNPEALREALQARHEFTQEGA